MSALGIRNNNPGNVIYDGTAWVGLTGKSGRFCTFDSPENGIRAIAKILAHYQKKPGDDGFGGYGLDTIAEIISRWAPDFENNTEAYIADVCKRTALDRNQIVTRDHWPELIAAIIHHENGEQPYTMDQIKAGIALAA